MGMVNRGSVGDGDGRGRSRPWVLTAVLVGLATLMAGVLWLTRSSELRTTSPAATRVSVSVAGRAADGPARSALSASSGRPTYRWTGLWSGYSTSGATYGHGLNVLATSYGADSHQVASYRSYWTHACFAGDGGPLVAGQPEAKALLARFCTGVTRLDESAAVSLYKRSTRVVFASELAGIERAQGVDAALDFAEEFLREAKDPFSLRSSMDYLHQVGVVVPPDSTGAPRDAQRLRVYEMARDSFICELSGGCSEHSPLSAKFCIEHGCSQLWSYRAQVWQQLSPADRAAYNWYLKTFAVLRGLP